MDVVIDQKTSKMRDEDPFSGFLNIPFNGSESISRVAKQLAARSYPRKLLGEILKEYNLSIGNDKASMENILRLAQDTSICVVTGQQLGFASGPTYTILKAVSCLLAAKSVGAVPVFWLATDDHDLHEISTTYTLDAIGNLKKYHLALPANGIPVEDIILSEKNCEEIKAFCNGLGITTLPLPKAGDHYALAMARWLTVLFAGTGLVFVEPRLLRPHAASFFVRELKESAQIQRCLSETTRKLEKCGGVPTLKFTEGTNLFIKDDKGIRVRLKSNGAKWTAGPVDYTLEQLVSLAEKTPERFSTNVASRPLLQNAFFPTAAYVAGPSELAYHHQLADYHSHYGIPMPCLVPRINATLIPPAAHATLIACGLNPWDQLPRRLEGLQPDVAEDAKAMQGEWRSSAQQFFGSDLSLDALARYVRLGAEKVQKRVVRARLKHKGIHSYDLHLVHNLIHPHELTQERVLNWLGFQASADRNLIKECLVSVDWTTTARQYLFY